MEKYTLRNCLDYTKKIIELTKAGKEIDLSLTRSYYGKTYTIVVKQDEIVKDNAPAADVVDEATVDSGAEDSVQEETKEQVAQEEADEAKKPVARGRKGK